MPVLDVQDELGGLVCGLLKALDALFPSVPVANPDEITIKGDEPIEQSVSRVNIASAINNNVMVRQCLQIMLGRHTYV